MTIVQKKLYQPINEYIKNDTIHWKIKFLFELYAKNQKKPM
jgi:hypothetical protein